VAKRRRATRKSGANHEQNWTGLIQEDVSVDDTPVIEAILVTGSDWTASTGLSRATLLRIRGWLKLIVASPLETTVASFYSVVYVTDVDAPVLTVGTNGPADAAVGLEDLIWTGGTPLPASNAGNVSVTPVYDLGPIDIKSMRKLTSDQQVRLAMVVGSSNVVVSVSAFIRSLVRSGA